MIPLNATRPGCANASVRVRVRGLLFVMHGAAQPCTAGLDLQSRSVLETKVEIVEGRMNGRH